MRSNQTLKATGRAAKVAAKSRSSVISRHRAGGLAFAVSALYFGMEMLTHLNNGDRSRIEVRPSVAIPIGGLIP